MNAIHSSLIIHHSSFPTQEIDLNGSAMLSLFANPFTMIAGALLISSPIIIHLINRMRYKRVRWAAMEFLLKSQKRSRRKLIIEQMILLALRILMVLLVGLLLARFVGCENSGTEGAQTYHYILIDDTLSTSDTIRNQDGQSRPALDEAKRLVVEQIAGQAAQATSPQYCSVALLSQYDQPARSFGRLNPTTVEEIRSYLAPIKPSLRHVDLTEGLKAAKTEFEKEKTMGPVLHVVGDFRSVDWSDRNKEVFGKAFEELNTAGVKTHLMDCVSPERTPQMKTPLASDNLAIVDFAPDARIVPKNKEVEFTVRVHNYSNSEKKAVFLRVRVNGQIREDGSVAIPSVPPNGETIAKINLGSGLQRGAEDETEDGENAGMPLRFNLVSVHLEGEVGGIEADNTRYTVVEVRDRVPILLVDNNPTARGTKEAESFFLQKLFTEPIKGYDVQIKGPADLDNMNLQPYAAVYLCDVPRLTDNARKNLEEYVRGGGGLAFFMGPSIKSDVVAEYNEKLYRKGEGVFPVPLDKIIGADVPDDKRITERLRRMFTFNKKLLIRKDMRNHPALEKLYKDNRGQTVANEDEYEKFFNFVIIDRYVSVNQQQLRGGLSGVDTLVYLQNTKPLDNYTKAVNDLTDRLSQQMGTPKFEKYADALGRYRTELRRIAGSTEELYRLGEALTYMLEDKGDEATKRPGLVDFWAHADNAQLREDFEKLRDEVRYGDPLYVAKAFGKGRVVAFLTSAGASWNDMEGPGRAYYPPMMINMQGYLASSGTDANLVLGGAFEFSMDRNAYDSKVRKWHYFEDVKANKAIFKPLGDEVMPTDDKSGAYRLLAQDGKNEPGVYVYKFAEKRAEGGKAAAEGSTRPDYRVLPFNVDALAEGNLARANTDDITQMAAKAPLHVASDPDDSLKSFLLARKRDLSENPWIYFVMLMVLIFEQAMAVRLSFHSRPSEDASLAPVGMGRPAMATA
jgi:Aerotolerance regulator N-terminal